MEKTNKIFIDREPGTGDFLMRMPEDALPDFYEMLCASPLLPRRWLYQVKEHLETEYRGYISRGVQNTRVEEKGGEPC